MELQRKKFDKTDYNSAFNAGFEARVPAQLATLFGRGHENKSGRSGPEHTAEKNELR